MTSNVSSNEESLLTEINAPEVLAAAAGLRPAFRDTHDLPLYGENKTFRFAPLDATYGAPQDRTNGTNVTIFGVTPEGHSVSVVVSGFFPYLYIRLGDLDPQKLVWELDATLIAALALKDEAQWSLEHISAREAIVGRVRTSNRTNITTLFRASVSDDVASAHPIVGWEVVLATMLRGSGEQRGYRGLEPERFLKIYLAKPHLVTKIKQLCHGVANEFGPEEQARKLGAAGTKSSMATRLEEEKTIADAARLEKEERQRKETARYQRLDNVLEQKKEIVEEDEEDEDDEDDEEDGELEAKVDDSEFKAQWVPHGQTELEGDDERDEEEILTELMHQNITEEEADPDDDGSSDVPRQSDTDAEDDKSSSNSHIIDSAHNEPGDGGAGKRHIEELANKLFRKRALQRLAEVRGKTAQSYLNRLNKCSLTLTVCEADIDFVLRVMIDMGVCYNQFAEIDMQHVLTRTNCHEPRALPNSAAYEHCDGSWAPPGTPPGIAPVMRRAERALDNHFVRPQWTYGTRTTTTQLEVHCDFHAIRLCADKQLQSTLPRTLTISFDCEMETHDTFPKPETEAILQIGCVVALPNGKRREIGFTIGRVARGPGEYIDAPDLPVGSKRAAPDEQRTWRRTLDPDVESEHILCFATEEMMLAAFATFVRAVDADAYMTYNGDNFDFPFLIQRASVLGKEVEKVVHNAWGRTLRQSAVKMRDRSYGSTAIGKHEYKEISANGILFYDLFQYLKRNPMIKLRSYSLNSVAKEYINMEKENVAYSQINELQKTAEGRRKLLVYCIRDSLLPVLIDRKRTISQELVERSRGTGVTVQMLLKRGMQIQCRSYLYRKSRIGMLVPAAAAGIAAIPDAGRRRLCMWYTRTDEERRVEMDGGKFGGATVVDPRRGLHDVPIGTLDFFSLYPSIIISGNYCCSTLLAANFNWENDVYLSHLVRSGAKTPEQLFMYVGTVDAEETPFREYIKHDASRFLRHDVLRGFVPEIERELLSWRTDVKGELKGAKRATKALREKLEAAKLLPNNEVECARLTGEIFVASGVEMVLDKRQLSVKLIANSLYGFFGAKTASGYCRDLADSVTRRGRAAILFAKHITDTMVDDLTPDSPLCRQVAAFAGVTNKLISIRPGKEVVDELCALLVEARKSKPAPKKKKVIVRDMKDFLAAASGKSKVAAAEVVAEELVRISTFYGDTDSLFIGFWDGIDFTLAARILIALADFVSILLHQRYPTVDPNDCVYRFEFEKIFRTLLMLAKKRYVGIKYLWDKDKRALVPANPDNEFEPSESGLETQRRDTTRLISEGMSPVLEILLDPLRARKEKIERACSFIYRTMVKPLQDGSIQKRLIVQTRQLRKSPHEYLAPQKSGRVPKETSLPVHVQMALRAEREQGQPDAPDILRSGDRVAFIVVKGDKKEKSSSRGVDPVRVLEKNYAIDTKYYLDNHVAKALCRVFDPVLNADRTDIHGRTEKQRQRERLAMTREKIFGSRTEYLKPDNAEKYYEDTRRYDDKTRFAVKGLVRYHQRQVKVTTIDSLIVAGAHCQVCRVMFAGEARGFVCGDCYAFNKHGARQLAIQQAMRNAIELEELRAERASIFEYCQRCAHTAHCPTSIITCDESACNVFWERRENLQALTEANRRAQSAGVVLNCHQ